MGQIIRFPILVIDDKATEDRSGLAPQLQSTVRPLTAASTDAVASEQAIREALEEITFTVSGENLGTGLPIFDSTAATIPSTINYHSLSGMGVILISEDANSIYFDTTQSGTPGNEGFIITSKSINGGVEQEATRIHYANFETVSSMECFHNVVAGDAIGKIMIKCVTPFDSSATQYSIGTDNDPEAFVKKFNAPTVANRLVPIVYGAALYDKVEYIELSGSITAPTPIVEGSNIKVYRYGTANSAGEMQCVIFYDKFSAIPTTQYTNGWIYPGYSGNKYIETINYATNTVTVVYVVSNNYSESRSVGNGIIELHAFGNTGYDYPFKFAYTTFTFANQNYASAITNKWSPFTVIDVNSNYGIFWGSTSNNDIYRVPFSTETFAIVGTFSMSRRSGGNGRSSTYDYALGGSSSNAISKLNLSTITGSTIANTLSTTYNRGNGRYSDTHGYVVYSGTGKADVFAYSSETAALRSGAAASATRISSGSYQDIGSFVSNTAHYSAGGNIAGAGIIDSFVFANNTSVGIYNSALLAQKQYMATAQS